MLLDKGMEGHDGKLTRSRSDAGMPLWFQGHWTGSIDRVRRLL
jgi:hypothetical protein